MNSFAIQYPTNITAIKYFEKTKEENGYESDNEFIKNWILPRASLIFRANKLLALKSRKQFSEEFVSEYNAKSQEYYAPKIDLKKLEKWCLVDSFSTNSHSYYEDFMLKNIANIAIFLFIEHHNMSYGKASIEIDDLKNAGFEFPALENK